MSWLFLFNLILMIWNIYLCLIENVEKPYHNNESGWNSNFTLNLTFLNWNRGYLIDHISYWLFNIFKSFPYLTMVIHLDESYHLVKIGFITSYSVLLVTSLDFPIASAFLQQLLYIFRNMLIVVNSIIFHLLDPGHQSCPMCG